MKDIITVLLVDDHAMVLQHVALFLNMAPRLSVVATAQCGAEGIEQARLHQPDVILVDLCMPMMDGFEAIPLLKQAAPKACVIALTMLEEDDYWKRALRCGADGYVTKATMAGVLLPEIERLHGLNVDASGEG